MRVRARLAEHQVNGAGGPDAGTAARERAVATIANVIIENYGDNVIRTQISVDEELYARAKIVARRKGISLAELCRRGIEEVVSREPVDRPWMAFAGTVEGRQDDSTSVDSVVYDRENP